VRLFRLLILLSAIPFMIANAQNKITLDEAVKLAYTNNIEIQKHNAIIRNAEINLDESSRLPNPRFSYSRENLKSNTLDYSEWTASGSLTINFLWERWSNLDSKEKALEANKLLLDHKKNIVASEVKINYFTLFNYSKLSKKFNKTLDRLIKLSESAQHRLEEGDISEYKYQRILIELKKIEKIAKEVELQKIKYQNNLQLLTGLEIEHSKLSEVDNGINNFYNTREELLIAALENRTDLKSIQLLIESEKLFLSHNKLKLIPKINLSAGYKEQLDNFTGTVFQFDFEIPLFDRNQSTINKSENSLTLLDKEMLFLREKIKTEIVEGYSRYTINKDLAEKGSNIQLGNLFDTALYSYEQGEIPLIEFIDGINAFIDGVKIANEIEISYMRSLFELEKAVGIKLQNLNNNQEHRN
jgi:outer membrane protein TolC